MAVNPRTRFEVLRRDNYTCRYCHATDSPLTVDHVIPTALGGSDDPSNLVAACRDCNAGKGASSPDMELVAQVSEDALRWAAAVRQAAQEVAAEQEALQDRLWPFVELWDSLVPSYKAGQSRYRLPENWEASVIRLLEAGLPDDLLLQATRTALTSGADNCFRYMVGVANRMLADLHERARRILDEGDA